MSDDTNPRVRAIGALAEMFTEIAFGADGFADLERDAIDAGHGYIAEALARHGVSGPWFIFQCEADALAAKAASEFGFIPDELK